MSQIKINLGSGNLIVDGWISIDNVYNIKLSKYPFLKKLLHKFKIISKNTYKTHWDKKIIKHNIIKMLPFSTNEIDYIYSSHVLEHFTHDDALIVCENVYDALKPEGIFRVVLPDDLKLIVSKYINNNTDSFGDNDSAANQLLNTIRRNVACKENIRYNLKTGGNVPTFIESFFNTSSQHKWMYDSNSLKHLLISAGFNANQIYECEYRQGQCPDLDKLENRKDNNIFIEATK